MQILVRRALMMFALPVLERVVMRTIRKFQANRATKKNGGNNNRTDRAETIDSDIIER